MNDTETVAGRLNGWCADVGVGAAEVEPADWAGDGRRLWGWEIWGGQPPTVAFCPELIVAVAADVDEYVDTVMIAAGAELVVHGADDERVEEARSAALIEHDAMESLWSAHCSGIDNVDGVRGDLAGDSEWAERLGL